MHRYHKGIRAASLIQRPTPGGKTYFVGWLKGDRLIIMDSGEKIEGEQVWHMVVMRPANKKLARKNNSLYDIVPLNDIVEGGFLEVIHDDLPFKT